MNKERRLTVISAPSGCGKDTVAKLVAADRDDIKISVSCTTRQPRTGEVHGVDYYYITREEFLDRIQNGRMLEYNCYADNFYGTPKDELEDALENGTSVILVIDVNGARNVKEIYPDALLIFLMPPSMEELMRRLKSRNTDSDEDIAKRMQIAEQEMSVRDMFDVRIVNDSLDLCVAEVEAAMEKWQHSDEINEIKTQKEKDMNKTKIGKLLEENESAYSLVIAVAKRARDIASNAEENGVQLTEKPVTLAINEFDEKRFMVQKADKQ